MTLTLVAGDSFIFVLLIGEGLNPSVSFICISISLSV